MKTKSLTTTSLKIACVALALSASVAVTQAAIVVTAGSGVYRYSDAGALEHTYTSSTGSNWQGVAADNSTGNIYVGTALGIDNGALFQYAFNGVAPSKEIMSPAYAGGGAKSTIGVTFNNGLVIANPYFFDLGAAEVSGFNPANPTDTTPTAGNSWYPSNATGITYSPTVAGRYYFTDFTGSVWQLNDFGIGGTPNAIAIVSGLSGGIRGLALSPDETSLFVADQSLNKVIKINLLTNVATDFITSGVASANDVLQDGSFLYVSTSTGVDKYLVDGTLVQNDFIALADSRYLAFSSVPEPSTYGLILIGGLAVFVARRRLKQASIEA